LIGTEKSPGALNLQGFSSFECSVGGEEEDRTPDLRIANAALSQLSYVPTGLKYSQRPAERKLARRRGATGIAV
jgi:hypothetical protein